MGEWGEIRSSFTEVRYSSGRASITEAGDSFFGVHPHRERLLTLKYLSFVCAYYLSRFGRMAQKGKPTKSVSQKHVRKKQERKSAAILLFIFYVLLFI